MTETVHLLLMLVTMEMFLICYHLWKFIRKYEIQCITTYINKIFLLMTNFVAYLENWTLESTITQKFKYNIKY
jgi:hypothetical protein